MRQNEAGGMTGTTLEAAVAGVRPVPRGISPCRPAAAAIHLESAAAGAASRQCHVGRSMEQWALAMDRVRNVGEPIPMCKQLTGEPVAGKPHTGFGGRGRRSQFPSAFISSSWGG